jgi:hypothetical protein
VIELVERGGGIKDQESRLMLNQAIATGRSGVFQSLTEEQDARLEPLTLRLEERLSCDTVHLSWHCVAGEMIEIPTRNLANCSPLRYGLIPP